METARAIDKSDGTRRRFMMAAAMSGAALTLPARAAEPEGTGSDSAKDV
jgi:hypothetical protein